MSCVQVSHKVVKARKEHRCSFCNGIIEKGERYESSFNITEGNPHTWKAHISCQKLAEKRNWFHRSDQGYLSDDAFIEFVWNDYGEEFIKRPVVLITERANKFEDALRVLKKWTL